MTNTQRVEILFTRHMPHVSSLSGVLFLLRLKLKLEFSWHFVYQYRNKQTDYIYLFIFYFTSLENINYTTGWTTGESGFYLWKRSFSSPQSAGRLWGPPNLLYSRDRGLFPGCEVTRLKDNPPASIADDKNT
jgi:hypothetical protein